MICFECAKEITSYPCACGYKPISCTPTLRPTHHYEPMHDGPAITKDEFGLNLYETITTIGGIKGIDQQRAAAIHKSEGFKLQDLNARRLVLQKSLALQLPTLNDEEMSQVLARYPWVVQA